MKKTTPTPTPTTAPACADGLTWNEMNLAGAVCQDARVSGDDLARAWPANLRSRCRDVLGVRAMFDVAGWRVDNDRHYYAFVWLDRSKNELVELARRTIAELEAEGRPTGGLGRGGGLGWLTKRELVAWLLDAKFSRESWRSFYARHEALFKSREGGESCAA